MNWLRKLRKRHQLERDLADEIAFHREMRSGAADAPPFGNEIRIRERMRDEWIIPWIENTMRDVVYALRGFRASPGFAFTAISSLTLGIAAVIAIFTAADNLLFRPLPYPDGQRLVMVWEFHRAESGNKFNVISPGNFLDWQSRNHAFDGLAAFIQYRTVFTDRDRTEQLRAQNVSPNLFGLLGAQPMRGRLFTAAEDLAAGHTDSLLVISYRLWQTWFDGAPDIIGRRVSIDSLPRTIIGVMPPDFYFRDREVDLWAPLGLDPSIPYRKERGRYMYALGRLRRGVTMQQAQSEMTDLAAALERENPVFDKNWTVKLQTLRDSLVGSVRTLLWVLLAAVGLLMAVACSNVANLLLARYSSRRGEIAVRMALGAGRARLIRQLLTESLVLAVIAGIGGIALGKYALAGLVALAPQSITQTANIAIDWRIVSFAAGFSAMVGILFGIAPSASASHADIAQAMHRTGRWGSSRGGRIRAWLIVGEVGLSLMLLAGASLLIRTLVKLQHADPGLNPANLLTFRFSLPAARYRAVANRTALFAKAAEQIERLPGVQSASAVSFLPFDGMPAATGVKIAGKPVRPGELAVVTVRTVMPRYFATMGIPMRQGRDFSPADNRPESPLRFIVNEAFVRANLPNEGTLGKMISVDMDRTNPYGEIIGVAGDVKEDTLGKEAVPTVYYVHVHLAYPGMTILVRTQKDPISSVAAVRRIMHDLDPALPVASVRRMEAVLGATYGRERFGAILLGVFSLSAMLLAAIGIYGVLAYSVAERTREIGVRLALGAHPRRIITMVLLQGGRLVLIGFAIGMAGALAASKSLSGMLFEVPARDPVSFTVAPLALLGVALMAAWIPARRAARLDPVQALRVE
jgi:putative ABC transport system permease protein